MKTHLEDDVLSLRLATLHDADVLLEWRNDPETRNASHQTAVIRPEDHLSWLTRTVDDPDRLLFVAANDGVPVGTVRADRTDGVWELSWTVAPAARGRGLAKRMVALLAVEISEPIRAEIQPGHIASVRVAEHAGMVLHEQLNGVLHYRRPALR